MLRSGPLGAEDGKVTRLRCGQLLCQRRPGRTPVWLVPAGGALVTGLLFAFALTVLAGRHRVVLVVDDVGQLLAATVAALLCARTAVREGPGASRQSWGLLAGGVACWAAGQAVWSAYEVGLGREAPFPSPADVGFLLFPVIAAAGLLRWLREGDRAATRVRDLLDGVVIAVSLLTLSWATTLRSVVESNDGGRGALLLSLAYPVGDVVMATLVLLTLVRARPGHRAVQLLVAAGLGGLAVADSAYVYLINAGAYSSGSLISAGWLTGFLLIGAGAHSGMRRSAPTSARASRPGSTIPVVSRLGMVLPYLPLLVAEVAIVLRIVRVPGVPLSDLGLGLALIGLVLARQLLALTENRRLLAELGAARDQLRHQALHDSLTGLANRVLFKDRLEHALALRPEAGAEVAVLFCDVDDFKTVNDELGHGAGDELLLVVANRLREVLRPRDTVARLGGDEFAVLLEGGQDAQRVADRLVAAVARPCQLERASARVTLSVGIAVAGPGPGGTVAGERTNRAEPVVRELLREADTAMYAAKAAGKGRALLFQELPAGWRSAAALRLPPVLVEEPA